MKRAVIVHCWSGVPDSRWYPSTKKELEEAGFQVEVPAMPDTDEPQLSKWLPKLQEVIGEPDEDLYLIGHSIGCATIMRYLESLDDGQRVGGVMLVAGFSENLGFDEISNFFDAPLDFKTIKIKAKHFVLLHSDDDPYVDVKYATILKEALGAESIIQHGMGHFSEPDGGDDTFIVKELPIVAEKIIEMFNS